MNLSNALYNRLKFLSQIFLPAVGTLYFALAGIWGLPSAEEVVGTVVALDTFLGVMLGISSSAYSNNPENYDGTIHVLGDTGEDKRGYSLRLPDDYEKIENAKELRIKVEHLDT